VVTFAAGPARDFYIAASDKYTVVSETVGETKVNSYAFAERADGAKLALRQTVNALKSFNTAGFKQLAERHCPCDLTPLFEEWVYKR
jgi:hypothetical protein